MKKITKFFKKNILILLAFTIGLTLSGIGVYAATTYITASNVAYNNSTSKLSSTTVQAALDEAYKKADIRSRNNITAAYTYSTATSTKCITGEESTCVKTTCHKSTTVGSCPAGTIIQYKVNDTDIVTFHVMFDNGTTMTMQSQRNIVYNTMWISDQDYKSANTDLTSCSSSCNDEGPVTALKALEAATAGWNNVNNQTYTMGTTLFKTNIFTGCSSYNSCTTNSYTMDSRTVKARMITMQEAVVLGCTQTSKSCPKWLNNYLHNSTSGGGTANDETTDSNGTYSWGYWTMNANYSRVDDAWSIDQSGNMGYSNGVINTSRSIRAVVTISK